MRFYFDAHLNTVPGTPDDPNSNWSSDANAFDNDSSNGALNTSAGSTSSNYLLGKGTTAPTSGGVITSVNVRTYGNNATNDALAAIYTSGLGELLGTAGGYSGSPASGGISNYTTLSTPTGGWTWSAINQLETKIYNTDVSATFRMVEVEVYIESIPGRIYRVQGFQ